MVNCDQYADYYNPSARESLHSKPLSDSFYSKKNDDGFSSILGAYEDKNSYGPSPNYTAVPSNDALYNNSEAKTKSDPANKPIEKTQNENFTDKNPNEIEKSVNSKNAENVRKNNVETKNEKAGSKKDSANKELQNRNVKGNEESKAKETASKRNNNKIADKISAKIFGNAKEEQLNLKYLGMKPAKRSKESEPNNKNQIASLKSRSESKSNKTNLDSKNNSIENKEKAEKTPNINNKTALAANETNLKTKETSQSKENNSDFKSAGSEKTSANISRMNNSEKNKSELANDFKGNKQADKNDNQNELKIKNQKKESINRVDFAKVKTGTNDAKVKTTKTDGAKTTTVKIEDIAEKTAKLIKNMPDNSTHTARIMLKPDSLGALFVKIKLVSNTAYLRFEMENNKALKKLEARLGNLEEILSKEGIKTQAIDLKTRNAERYNNSNLGNWKRRDGRNEKEKLVYDFVRSFRNANRYS